ncbi:MFS transporter [Allokutzneria albata]|uniref:Predicted arabinose efflux permease, MFS family n=1 Tax=Allokutzneria albata TaxID=211114 RepID=A0A1G9TTR4_ALLAB|nr:MFS transporter [Allokutzneria albata]SDM51116.1 Predicted arabinose efflux permease, MFS family [Allokutzneria albata]
MLSSLITRSGFHWFFAGQLVSLLGNAMAPVALAFAVLDASGKAGDLGIVLAAHMVPMLGFLLVGGAVADRLPRRGVLVVSNLGCAITQGGVAALLLAGAYDLIALAALSFVMGVLMAFTTPALRGIVPELVEPDRLRQANALLGTARNAAKIIGPSVSGVLVAVAGGGPAIAFDAVSFLVAAACLTRLPRLGTTPPAKRTSVLADVREGWTTFRGIPWVWQVALAFCVVNLVNTGTWQILGPDLTRQISSEAAWGLVLSARGVGMLVMSAVMFRLATRHLLRWTSVLGAVGGLPLIVLGSGAGVTWLVVAAFVAGLGSSALAIGWETSLQEHVPAESLSRVSSYDALLSYIAIPFGQLAAGPAADALGGTAVALGAGVVYTVAVLLPLASAAVRQLPHNVSRAG